MNALERFACPVVFGIAITAGAAPVDAQSVATQEGPTPVRTELLMSTIGASKAPLLIAMNCPNTEKSKKNYIATLARNNKDPESVAALVDGSAVFLLKIEAAVGRGERNDPETTDSLHKDAEKLMHLASSVQNSGGLSFSGIKFGYKADSLVMQILSTIAVLYDQRIPAYTTAIEYDPVAADTLKSTIIEARLGELTQGHPGTSGENLKQATTEEVDIDRLEWIAIGKVIAAGLDNLNQGDGQAVISPCKPPMVKSAPKSSSGFKRERS